MEHRETIIRDGRRRAEPVRQSTPVLDQEIFGLARPWNADGLHAVTRLGQIYAPLGLTDHLRLDPAQQQSLISGEIIGWKGPAVVHERQVGEGAVITIEVRYADRMSDLMIEIAGVAALDARTILAVDEHDNAQVGSSSAYDESTFRAASGRRYYPCRIDDVVAIRVIPGDVDLLSDQRGHRVAKCAAMRVGVGPSSTGSVTRMMSQWKLSRPRLSQAQCSSISRS